ncbi:MAG: glycerate kinase [Candidatus Omnitrophica bacterium]|nr:glycerate kinase [Candidatus Omnitrophota bacterium]
MKILIAPNAFKGSLSSPEICHSLKDGILRSAPHAEIETVPLGDGGDGTLEVLVDLWEGTLEAQTVQGPLSRPVEAPIGFDLDRKRAVIEMARASGLALLGDKEKNPLFTSSFGTGQMLRIAIDSGVQEIFLGIGGSATNDGGAGMGAALGFDHMNGDGESLIPRGGNLDAIEQIIPPEFQNWPRVTVLCDVTNPLCGHNGASAVYGPQKGATSDQVRMLDRNLDHLARLWQRDLGRVVAHIPGSGAAGGMGGGAMAYLDARLVSGTDVLFEMTDLDERVQWADLVITGEGALDLTTLQGKIPGRVADLALKYKKKCIGICGLLQLEDVAPFENAGFTRILEIAPTEIPSDERIRDAEKWVFETGRNIGNAMAWPSILKFPNRC